MSRALCSIKSLLLSYPLSLLTNLQKLLHEGVPTGCTTSAGSRSDGETREECGFSETVPTTWVVALGAMERTAALEESLQGQETQL